MEGQQTFMPIDEFIPEVVKKRGWAGNANIMRYHEQQQKNAEALAFAMKTFGLKRVDTSDPEAIRERILWYLQQCLECNMKPTVSGFAGALGVSRMALWKWHAGEARPENYEIIEQGYNLLEQLWESYMMNGQINPVSGIFLGKNHFGYKDVQDIVVQPKNALGDEVDAEAIEEKYAALPDD